MNRENIVLTGFMGTGKSTVGRLLAKELQYNFVDTDSLIEQRCGMSIPDFFETKGEQLFRQLETEVTRELSTCSSQVISTGGGLILNPENVVILNPVSHIFCLVASPEEVLSRVSKGNNGERPLLAGGSPLEKITSLLEQRKEAYNQFPQITTTGKTPAQVSKAILTLFQSSL